MRTFTIDLNLFRENEERENIVKRRSEVSGLIHLKDTEYSKEKIFRALKALDDIFESSNAELFEPYLNKKVG